MAILLVAVKFSCIHSLFLSVRKYEEIYPPDVSEFCYITDDTYTKKQVLRMEHLILEVLGFECSPPTAHFFANHFSKLSGLAGTDKTLCARVLLPSIYSTFPSVHSLST